jgi:hypothetical protein
LLWGREILHGSGFSTSSYPSWKPLGALLALPVAATGSAAPALWLVLERTLALAGLVFAYRLASSLAGRVAGVIAVAGIVLARGWLGELLDGHLEPVVATALLGACWYHARGRRWLALGFLEAAALARPDAWPALLLYAAFLVARERRHLLRVLPAVALVPVVWFGGDLLGSGNAFHGGALARASALATGGSAGSARWLAALADGAGGALIVLAVAALVVFAYAVRTRERPVIAPGIVVLSWIAADVALAIAGYPVGVRFAMPAAAVATVLGAAGIVRGVHAVEGRLGSARLRAAGAVAAVVLVASAIPAVGAARRDAARAIGYSHNVGALAQVATTLQADGLFRCHPAVVQPYQTPLAWYMHRQVPQIDKPLVDGVAVVARARNWPQLKRLKLRAARHGGVAARRLAGVGVWRPLLLEPRRASADPGSAVCDRIGPRHPA